MLRSIKTPIGRFISLTALAALQGLALVAGLWLVSQSPAAAGDAKAETLEKAQALVAAAGLRCTVDDARTGESEEAQASIGGRGGAGLSGNSMGRMNAGGMNGGGMGIGSLDSSPMVDVTRRRQGRPALVFYEVACHEGEGFIFVSLVRSRDAGRPARGDWPDAGAASGAVPQYFNCLEAAEAAEKFNFMVRCELKANKDALNAIRGVASRIGLDCAVGAARGLAHTPKQSLFEIACAKAPDRPAQGGAGYILVTSRSVSAEEPAAAVSCFDVQANPNLRCQLTKVGGVIDELHRFVARTAPDCVPVNQRLVGASATGGKVFEVVCRGGAGFMLRRADDGAMDTLVACSNPAVAGKCQLKDLPPKS